MGQGAMECKDKMYNFKKQTRRKKGYSWLWDYDKKNIEKEGTGEEKSRKNKKIHLFIHWFQYKFLRVHLPSPSASPLTFHSCAPSRAFATPFLPRIRSASSRSCHRLYWPESRIVQHATPAPYGNVTRFSTLCSVFLGVTLHSVREGEDRERGFVGGPDIIFIILA